MLADVQNVLAKHEMFEEIGGGETSKQGQEVESVSCQANNVGQFRQALNVIPGKSISASFENIIFKIFWGAFSQTPLEWSKKFFGPLARLQLF